MLPSVVDCALLSEHVYRFLPDSSPPPGWEVFRDYNALTLRLGYFASCYIKKEGNTIHVVFAHRGTIVSIRNLLEDLQIMVDQAPYAFTVAKLFINDCIEDLHKQYPNCDFTVTQAGHSLGAIIAELLGVYYPYNGSVSFDSPGSAPLIANMVANKQLPADADLQAKAKCIIIMADVDAINTYHTQCVQPYRIAKPIYTFNGLMEFAHIDDHVLFDTSYMIYSYYQHNISNIVQTLTTDGFIMHPLNPYPAGIRFGHQAYLDPNRLYWKEYINYLWDKKTDFNTYYNDFIKKLPRG